MFIVKSNADLNEFFLLQESHQKNLIECCGLFIFSPTCTKVILAFREHSIDCFNTCSLSQSLHGGDGGFKQNCRNIEQTMGDKKKSRKAESDDPDQYKHGRKQVQKLPLIIQNITFIFYQKISYLLQIILNYNYEFTLND